jgi:phosphoribosyl-ATP pyrophosphohydrolase/phosphoribosyl-AMP cyclohydrolase
LKFPVEADFISKLRFDKEGLIPVIVQEWGSGEVLMLAYQNREALEHTLATGSTWFFSRSRQELWHKGATSGHYQKVKAIYYDCDADTLLIQVVQQGRACHENFHSCFHYRVDREKGTTMEEDSREQGQARHLGHTMGSLREIVAQRQKELPEGSYTTYLFRQGLDKILKKFGEEATEVIIAAKNQDQEELVYETADLLYHLIVLLTAKGVSLERIRRELDKRRK